MENQTYETPEVEVEVETTTQFEEDVQDMVNERINEFEEGIDVDVDVDVNIDGYVEKNKAVGYGIGGVIISGVAGFVGGKYYESKKRNKLLEAISERIIEIGDGKVELNPSEKKARVDVLTDKIVETLQNQKVSEKEKQKWRETLTLLAVVAARKNIENAEEYKESKKNNDTIVDEGEK